MICERCGARLGKGEGRFILWRKKEICVCSKCFEEIRAENIKRSYPTYTVPEITAGED